MGSMGLAAFALLVSQEIAKHSPRLVLTIATIAWQGVSVLLWRARKRL